VFRAARESSTNRIHFVLVGMHNRTFGPYLAANNRILVSVMAGPSGACQQHTRVDAPLAVVQAGASGNQIADAAADAADEAYERIAALEQEQRRRTQVWLPGDRRVRAELLLQLGRP
jgi:hypothetical protein